MKPSKYAISITARLFDDIVGQSRITDGKPVEFGSDDALGVPVPEGCRYFARLQWNSMKQPEILAWQGSTYLLGLEEPVRVSFGPVSLSFQAVQTRWFRRTRPWELRASLPWFTVVLAMTLLAQQAEFLWSKRCVWFAVGCEVSAGGQDLTALYTAEYLARLLREDYAGEEGGLLETERRSSEKKSNKLFMPSGAKGPAESLGGGSLIGEQRESGDDQSSAQPKQENPLQLAIEKSTPQPHSLPLDSQRLEIEQARQAKELNEGFGLTDWYDVADERMEQVEIEVMLREARRRLLIEPADPEALMVLSYYQYLAKDYEAAAGTYDRFIELFPNDASGYNNKALIYKRKGNYKQEQLLYDIALSLEPLDVTALNNLAVNLSHQNRGVEGLAIMDALETLDPDNPYAELHRAKIMAQLGDTESALRFLEKALAGMQKLDTLHHIEFRQDIRLDPSFMALRKEPRFHALLARYYGDR